MEICFFYYLKNEWFVIEKIGTFSQISIYIYTFVFISLPSYKYIAKFKNLENTK